MPPIPRQPYPRISAVRTGARFAGRTRCSSSWYRSKAWIKLSTAHRRSYRRTRSRCRMSSDGRARYRVCSGTLLLIAFRSAIRFVLSNQRFSLVNCQNTCESIQNQYFSQIFLTHSYLNYSTITPSQYSSEFAARAKLNPGHPRSKIPEQLPEPYPTSGISPSNYRVFTHYRE
jgi:hypothetical protein